MPTQLIGCTKTQLGLTVCLFDTKHDSERLGSVLEVANATDLVQTGADE